MSMERIQRQRPFLQSILNEANRYKRQEMLLHANGDQINAVSELVLNLLKKKIPMDASSTAKLKRYKTTLREVGKRRNSLKRRRALLTSQKGEGFWKGLKHVNHVCTRACK